MRIDQEAAEGWYVGVSGQLLVRAGAQVGDLLEVKGPDGSVNRGLLMPHHEFSSEDVIVLKLPNGYNIGVAVDEASGDLLMYPEGDKSAAASANRRRTRRRCGRRLCSSRPRSSRLRQARSWSRRMPRRRLTSYCAVSSSWSVAWRTWSGHCRSCR